MSESFIRKDEHLEPGQVIEGKYRIERLLAEGGMGSVYHAVQSPLGRDVALKVLKPQADTDEKRRQRYERFFREARHTSRLNHPNTVVIYDYGTIEDGESFFFVMEFLEGRSLREMLVEEGALPVDKALHVAIQIASSLCDAHAAGVIHRDLKPPNVMLVHRGDDAHFVKVVDFGLVKDLNPDSNDDELTAENALIGSPMYMAPERFLYTDADSPSVDVYALGVILYEMLVGRPPFMRDSDSTVHRIMMMHIQEEPPPMVTFRPDLKLPDGLERLVMKCLEKEPEDRFPDMDSVLHFLRSCASQTQPLVGVAAPDTRAAAEQALRADVPSGSFLGPSGTEDETRPAKPADLAAARASGQAPAAGSVAETPLDSGSGSRWGLVGLIGGILVLGALALLMILPFGPPQMTLKVVSDPPGAMVYSGGVALGETPTEVKIEEATTLRFEKSGYYGAEHRVETVESGAREVSVALEIAPSGMEPAQDGGQEPGVDPDVPSEQDPVGEPSVDDQQPEAKPDTKKRPKPKPKPRPKPKPKTPPDVDIKLDR